MVPTLQTTVRDFPKVTRPVSGELRSASPEEDVLSSTTVFQIESHHSPKFI